MAGIKICGLRRDVDVDYVNELLPDYAGFIMTSGFRRSIDFDLAVELGGRIDSRIKRVGVFVDEPLENIERAISSGCIDIVQLHGRESVEYCKKINAPVIKALKPDCFGMIEEYEPAVDYLLFDSGTGTGRMFDWSMIPNTSKPFFLAGGLDSSNILDAIEVINPYAVDLSSSVESDGFKDYDKIKEIIDIVRR